METREKTSASPNTHHGHAIKRLRRDKQMSQQQLGDLIGMTQQAIYRYEKEKVLDEDIRERIAKGLGVSVELINELEEDKPLAFYIENNKIMNSNVGGIAGNSIGSIQNPEDTSLKMALDKLENAYALNRKQYEINIDAYKQMVEFLKKENQELKEMLHPKDKE